jgi:flavin prenyltransferase
MPAFYHRPTTLEEVIDQTVNRALDLLGIELDQDLFPRWNGANGKVLQQPKLQSDASSELVTAGSLR